MYIFIGAFSSNYLSNRHTDVGMKPNKRHRGQGVEDVGAAGVPHPERTDRRPVHREPHQLRAQRQVPRDFLRRQLGATLVVKHKAAEN